MFTSAKLTKILGCLWHLFGEGSQLELEETYAAKNIEKDTKPTNK